MRIFKTLIMIIALGLIVLSCKKNDDDFIKVSAFENALHNEVNKYRSGQGQNELVLQFVMVKEAQAHSQGWANGNVTVDNYQFDIDERWDIVEDKLGRPNISNQRTIIYSITTQSAEEVVADWAADSTYNSWLLDDLTQSGPGIGTTSDGRTYITYMLCKYTNP